MSHTALQANGHINRLQAIALSKEIGERPRFDLDSDRTVTPLQLLKLMTQLQRVEAY